MVWKGEGGFGHTQTHRTIIGSNYSKEIVANLLLASLHALLLHQHGKVMGQWEGERMEIEEVQGGCLQKYRVSIIAQLLHSCRVISIYKQLIFLIYPRRAAPAPERDIHLLASRRDMPLATWLVRVPAHCLTEVRTHECEADGGQSFNPVEKCTN